MYILVHVLRVVGNAHWQRRGVGRELSERDMDTWHTGTSNLYTLGTKKVSRLLRHPDISIILYTKKMFGTVEWDWGVFEVSWLEGLPLDVQLTQATGLGLVGQWFVHWYSTHRSWVNPGHMSASFFQFRPVLVEHLTVYGSTKNIINRVVGKAREDFLSSYNYVQWWEVFTWKGLAGIESKKCHNCHKTTPNPTLGSKRVTWAKNLGQSL